jgi:hypothetical protein
MKLHKTISELRRQLQLINEVIFALERLEPERTPKRGRPPKYADASRLSEPQSEMAGQAGATYSQ